MINIMTDFMTDPDTDHREGQAVAITTTETSGHMMKLTGKSSF